MTPITLSQMKDICLMDRLDFKFVAPVSLLPDLLEEMESDFMVQDVDNKRIALYATQYFDTSDMGFFRMHQNGKLNRQKIRIRTYIESNSSFLEVKNKNNKGRTNKVRTPFFTQYVDSVDELNEEKNFIAEHSIFDFNSLVPSLENSFRRITLINNNKTERITIDTDISFFNYKTHNKKQIDSLMVLELKQNGFMYSPFRAITDRLEIRRHSFSKYCVGIVLTDSEVKYNNFKGKLIRINKLLKI